MEKITRVEAVEIHDSRGTPTITVTVHSGLEKASASVPSGKSAGRREACELRDADGVGVARAIVNVNTAIDEALRDAPLDPEHVDRTLLALDGTSDKHKLGANAMLGVSMATMRLAAFVRKEPLWKTIAGIGGFTPGFPFLYMNMLNGGAHASFRLPFQEYIVAVGRALPSESYAKANAIFETLGTLIKQRYGDVPMGDEGGYSPDVRGIEKPFELLSEAMGAEAMAFLAIDAAASEFFHDGKYVLEGAPHTSEELFSVYENLVQKFHLKSIEDPFAEDDFSAFHRITAELGNRTLIVGDDLTVTNPEITKEMIDEHRANSMIIKPNQVGTLAEVFQTAHIAQKAGWKLIASHRSGETEDSFIADLAVGIGAYGLKAGAPTQKERRVKYERLLEIEKEFLIHS
ncbi:MAG: Enolase [Parcubacteria group bacterium GW2011_GWA2_47_7]|nr:MAG: Enolase [Parcubacteria group bacterium GW2011_GWA2_47_7]